ncbi:GNAT family N-acetyltransferase [Paramagnetospirillum kuznetsovii]|uniref:GNAT family N-acetyltransferase n=1 Tax=Paramagnetospirillum kuznetsovii TaxID=2053833 RepID=A0A364NWZ8_9PROT|nr:GNAT family N-acetyltransferase [Paramagnetospirillum kuznetsovii]RAU21608.1 GNAT family N-acetyltransferase [Paramagnetospirillum kuznetsovii]
MPDGADHPTITAHAALGEIPAAEWDACAGADNPFVSHAFLNALEQSGSACSATGWLPRHLSIRSGDGRLLAVAPLYLKSHSYGEYVFDWGWAEAYQRAGGRYYPKLQCAVPFTPVTGPRLLIRPGEDAARLRRMLASAMVTLARQIGASSVHVTFPTEAEYGELADVGFLQRLGSQYHWTNDFYGCFDDFLAALSSRKRKAIRKERDAVARQNIAITTLVGDDIKPRHWDVFHRFYQDVVDRKWGKAYVNRAFFEALSATPVADKVVLVWAEGDGQPLGAAFNMLGADTLYGRTWGAGPHRDFLHFEACYYRAIDFAIAHKLARVEAGAQGEHKVSRGYLPTPTYSAHWIADAGLNQAVAHFLDHERPLIAEDIDDQMKDGPFRQT